MMLSPEIAQADLVQTCGCVHIDGIAIYPARLCLSSQFQSHRQQTR